jgi:hypothetical protein
MSSPSIHTNTNKQYRQIVIKDESEIPYWKQVMELHGWRFEHYLKSTKTLIFSK